MEGMFFDSYDTPVFRPPSEARSFILRVTRGCAHNRCTYCNMYRGVRFERLDDQAILRQIALAEHYGKRSVRRVFLADGDAFVLDTDRLLAILAELHRAFPLLERVSSYAAPRDILRKSPEEMEKLREAGLGLLYYGMESGDTETLRAVRKGVTGEESVAAGQRVIASGMQLSIMTILGLAGAPGSRRHALATAEAISAIRPTMWSALCLMLYRGSELKDQFERGSWRSCASWWSTRSCPWGAAAFSGATTCPITSPSRRICPGRRTASSRISTGAWSTCARSAGGTYTITTGANKAQKKTPFHAVSFLYASGLLE